jgi:hypothetical protein
MNLKRKGIDESSEYFCLGDHLDIQAICEMYDCSCEIFSGYLAYHQTKLCTNRIVMV